MKSIFIKLFFVFNFIFFSFNNVIGFDINSLLPIKSYVIDKVGILNETQKTEIEKQIEEVRKKYTAEILLVIIPSTNGDEISSLGRDIGHKVGVGKSDKDNGIVILIAVNDRAWNISTGYGVEGVLPDLLTKRIGEKNFVLFKEQKYFEGLNGTISDIDKVLSGDESIISSMNESSSPDISPIFIWEFIFILFISGVIFRPMIKAGKYKKVLLYLLVTYIIALPIAYMFVGAISVIINLIIWTLGPLVGIFGKSGKGGRNSSGGGSSGGGFGGFGGGGFGGGGSSGKW